MTQIDWAIVGLYVIFAIWIGVHFSKKASENSEEFFVAGRSLPWWIAGTSMVATTFSADTPLFVAAASRDDGISANWIWWAALMANLATVFFFAKLWRRSGAITEIEFVEIRYGASKAASTLRVFRALFDGVFLNCVIMASVTLAMSKIVVVMLGLPDAPLIELPFLGGITPTIAILIVLGVAAVGYTALSGLYGVVYTDLIQFALAMIGAVALSVIVYLDMVGQGGVVPALAQAPEFDAEKLLFVPKFQGADIATFTFIILVLFSWLSTASGPGFFVQRTLATRSERDAVLSVFWYTFCHYVLRSWPWIFVGVASLIYFPTLVDTEQAYPLMIDKFLPVGLKGIMVASLLAAFMSTLDTHINWGTSYLINDIYRPFVKKGKSEAHYIVASRIAMLVLTLVALIVTTKLTGILAAYKYLIVMMSGIAFVLIARWYWWRINVWSEISSLISALIVGNLLFVVLPDTPDTDLFAVRLFLNLAVTTIICIAVTYATSERKPSAYTVSFYEKLRVAGPGWKRCRDVSGVQPRRSEAIGQNLIGWVSSIALIYGALFAIGHAIFNQWFSMLFWLAVSIAAGFIARGKLEALMSTMKDET